MIKEMKINELTIDVLHTEYAIAYRLINKMAENKGLCWVEYLFIKAVFKNSNVRYPDCQQSIFIS